MTPERTLWKVFRHAPVLGFACVEQGYQIGMPDRLICAKLDEEAGNRFFEVLSSRNRFEPLECSHVFRIARIREGSHSQLNLVVEGLQVLDGCRDALADLEKAAGKLAGR
jgi:hypothetical protein